MTESVWSETLGCPKNEVDSDKLVGTMLADGLVPAESPELADVVVVNTCAFVEQARQESIDTILGLDSVRAPGARLVVTGCMAERYGEELADALPEIDSVAGFGVPVTLGSTRGAKISSFDLLNLPRPKSSSPWAYVKVAEGCDRACGFCAIPSFRGKQRSRSVDDILTEVDALEAREIVLVAQDLAAYGRDQGVGERSIVPLMNAVSQRVDRVRLLYLYPSDLTDELIDTICGSGVPYFDLSLQHVSSSLLRGMKRWGDGERFAKRIDAIREREPAAAFRSNFIVGYPGETEEDFQELCDFVSTGALDRMGVFTYSQEDDTYAYILGDPIPQEVKDERRTILMDIQKQISHDANQELIGKRVRAMVEQEINGEYQCRTERDAPEVDNELYVRSDTPLKPGDMIWV